MKWEEGEEKGDVEDRRGVKPAMAAGGGLAGLVIMALIYFVTGDARQAKQLADKVAPQINARIQKPAEGGGGDAKTKEFSEKILGFINSVWEEQLPERYTKPTMVLFTGEVESEGCGRAPSAVGPFYCPISKKLFLDPTFFDELEDKLGGSKSDFSKAYVISHEVGHHVQNLLGYNNLLERYRSVEGENAGIRLELQADYLAGVCWHHVEKKRKILERGDIESAITTAKSIGDDRLQKRAKGWVNPESFNHGTSAQRLKHFMDGIQTGDASKAKLDTFFNKNKKPLDL